MKCPNCTNTNFPTTNSLEPYQLCPSCGWEVCRQCAGSGAIGAPWSGSDPSCDNCCGEGGFDPEWAA